MLKASVLFPAGNGSFPDPIFIDDYKDIQAAIGGEVFTTVSVETDADGQPISLVGFIPDDIYERSENTINWYASALFGQELYGPCVVAWGLSPNGYRDGDIYDMPDGLSQYLFGAFTEKVLEAYTEATVMGAMFRGAVSAGVLSEEELDELMDFVEAMSDNDTSDYTDEERIEMMLLLNRVENYVLVLEREKDDK